MTIPVRSDPAELILGAVDSCLDLAATWDAWDGRPRVSEATEDIPEGTVFTPHKAIRRIADHLVDHLAQLEVLLAGAEPIPDTWHGRTVTLATDWAPFTEADLNEAGNRLRRLGQVYALRLRSLDEEALDAPLPRSCCSPPGRSSSWSRSSSTPRPPSCSSWPAASRAGSCSHPPSSSFWPSRSSPTDHGPGRCGLEPQLTGPAAPKSVNDTRLQGDKPLSYLDLKP